MLFGCVIECTSSGSGRANRFDPRPGRGGLASRFVAATLLLASNRGPVSFAADGSGGLAARRGGGFGSRPRISPNRPVSRRPVTRRNPNTGRALRNLSRGLLQALGIAFLLSLLFGIGSGGSPLGLLLLIGLIALFVMARRRRRHYGYR